MRRPLGTAVMGLGLIMAACASSGTTGGKLVLVDGLSAAQRDAALLSPDEVPVGRGCTINTRPPPAPEAVLDVDGYRAALDDALTTPPTGDVVLSVGADSTGRAVWLHVVRASLPHSMAAVLDSTLKGHLKPVVRNGRPTGWQYRLKVTPGATNGFIRLSQSFSCRPRVRNRNAVSQRIDQALAGHPNITRLPDRQRTTLVWVHVGRDGEILKAEVHKTSGRIEVDRIAMDAVSVALFEPALLDGEPVAVWVSLPIVVQRHGHGVGGDWSPPSEGPPPAI